MGLAHEKKSYLQEKANLFEIGSLLRKFKCRFKKTGDKIVLLSEFIRRTGFPPEFADTLSFDWQEGVDAEALPECFTEGFFGRYAKKLSVPTPFAPELPELNARVAAEPALRVYANLIIDAAFRRGDWGLGKWPAPEKLLTRRQCGLFQLLTAMSALPLIAESYRKIGLPAEYADGPAKWIGGTIAIYAAAHDGNPGHDLQQISWLKYYMENRLFRVGRFEFLVHRAPDWLPAIYRSRRSLSGRLAPDGGRVPGPQRCCRSCRRREYSGSPGDSQSTGGAP